MHDFVAHVLRRYYAQTDWNPYNSYLYLTSSSQAVLDFAIPSGLSLSISASPSPPFFTTYRLRGLPQLTGALGYIFASIEDARGVPLSLDLGGSSRDVNLKDFVERFRIIDTPRQTFVQRDEKQQTQQQDGVATTTLRDRRDYLLYGCMHIPSARVDALFTTRLAPTWQLLATAISVPPRNAFGLASSGTLSGASSQPSSLSEKPSDASLNATAAAAAVAAPGPPPGATNLQINLQQDTGRWFTEYSYSVDDGLLGFRVLHNLGYISSNIGEASGSISAVNGNGSNSAGDARLGASAKRIDDDVGQETSVGGGLQGRFSVGAELFVSPLEKSAGLSTGMRFTTLPDNVPLVSLGNPANASQMVTAMTEADVSYDSASPSQTPTTITATLNPMMGHFCTAYAARMARDVVACSRFDFNVYSYESELTVGAEYWLRGNKPLLSGLSGTKSSLPDDSDSIREEKMLEAIDRERRLQPREQSGISLRDSGAVSDSIRSSTWSLRDRDEASSGFASSSFAPSSSWSRRGQIEKADAHDQEDVAAEGASGEISADPIKAARSTTLGVLKGRMSTTGIVALMWCGRLRNCLVSIGLRGDLSASGLSGGPSSLDSSMTRGFSGPGKPLRGVGIDVIYFSQNGE